MLGAVNLVAQLFDFFGKRQAAFVQVMEVGLAFVDCRDNGLGKFRRSFSALFPSLAQNSL